MRTRNARLRDVERIHEIIAMYTQDGTLLPRSIAELCENVRDFVVVEDAEGQILGCGALHLYGQHLAEVRSIAVHPALQGKGAGRMLMDALTLEAERQEVSCVCLFTRIPEFFRHMGFEVATRELLPDKIYKDCINCPRLHACDEIAMFRGELPKFAILRDPNVQIPLVQISG